ncbi:MAG: glycosyltransferase family 2 protein [Bacteroidia bacterium]|nr:glycosyltransferase family 2 protein [Bacteroidia bacterium]
MDKLSVIIPCYFNEENIPDTRREILALRECMKDQVEMEVILVDDGSKDRTLPLLKEFHRDHPELVRVIKLSGNFGSYNAILAGMNHATGDCTIILTADLQDPPELIPKMYEHWKKGTKLVIANRTDREEGVTTKIFSGIYHSLMKKLALPNIPEGGFDLVLFDRQLREQAVRINEKNTNQIYLLAWMNYEYVCIPYTRRKREKGTSRWTFRKKLKLFIDSFVSFSFFPIRLISAMGLILGFLALCYALFIVIAKFSGMVPVEGWSSLMIVVLFVSSFQMIAIGIVGEYVWRALDAARQRPNYIIEEITEKK